MASYSVTHLETGETFNRRYTLVNKHLKRESDWQHTTGTEIEAFHRQLLDYGETALHDLPEIANDLGFKHVFLKDESTRFGLPSFKILGASWALHKTLCRQLKLDPGQTTLAALKERLGAVRVKPRLVTCTEGNWGRAVSRMAKYYDVQATIYVPGFMNDYTRDLIRGEGADLRVLEDGSYDDTIAAVQGDARESGALMLMDTSWDGYEEVPRWVTDGYSTMLHEVDRQVASKTGGQLPNLAIATVGVGSWAHSVVKHYKAASCDNKIVTVEPAAAPSLKESLHCGKITPVVTEETIMNGACCGTTSKIAWPILRDGVDVALVVTDRESHECVQDLQARSVNAGPCGAATLAALQKLCRESVLVEEERRDVCVVLFSTEGMREYDTSHL
ncbi:hypothetical protein LTR78_007966 [Recurvomyces mirabilis]|uniref:Tryptophan synthase beta chain-like PALP domain-containing protein n=1 Tax=Recurvomyces mirabilis TaxID=574656 RepID=A0AAE0WJ30_9PEZI|nr:hypothetical protein LTR78_007966 [Recurvomyces mirabilis]KAK5152502.1 hypothetical protein LTS14_008449 [Recurvomyces mirabilis]